MILGIDEAGRGPWAGPLVVGVVVLGGAIIGGLDDSKKLTKKRRELLYDEIAAKATAATGWVSAAELDEVGMSEALRLATRRAVEQIHVPYHEIIIDGTINLLAGTALEQYVTTLPKADALIPSVSAASIVAKVERDRYMTEQDAVYPGYGFAQHAGYGVAKHRAAIEQLGVTPLHRLSFAPLQKYRRSSVATAEQAHKRLVNFSKTSLVSAGPAQAGQSSKRKELFEKLTGLAHIAPHPQQTLSGSPTSRVIGNASETAAANYLVRQGHEIIERNWKTKYCEIDIISRKGDTLYFTEVKHRKNAKSGDGLAAITKKKQNQMAFAAKFYAHTNQLGEKIDLRLAAIATTGDVPEVVKFLELL